MRTLYWAVFSLSQFSAGNPEGVKKTPSKKGSWRLTGLKNVKTEPSTRLYTLSHKTRFTEKPALHCPRTGAAAHPAP